MPHCRYLRTQHHNCRASMRNDLCRQGQYEWHLMVDARLQIKDDHFLLRYIAHDTPIGGVVSGGVCVDGGENSSTLYRENLRFRYEKKESSNHSLSKRCIYPYQAFRTTNFFYHKSVLQHFPYDERIKGYGYEDVMLGRDFERADVHVEHIDNPVYYTSFEANRTYVTKTEEAIKTLCEFRLELESYSPLLKMERNLERFHLAGVMRLFHRAFSNVELRNLCGNRPRLLVFSLYKLGYASTLLNLDRH